MKSVTPSFADNDSANGLYKSSLFKTLFKDRKTLLDGYPAIKKGLAFPEPCLKFGSSSYTFKTTDIVDKVSCKHDDREFQARYKKDTGKFDLSCKLHCSKGLFALLKYEERGQSTPAYVFGLDILRGSLALNCKANLFTGNVKASGLVNADDLLKGLKLAGDAKLVDGLKGANILNAAWNVGCSYASPVGLTAVAFNGEKQALTLNHSLQVDKKVSAILEAVCFTSSSKNFKAPLVALGVGYQLDRDHQLRCRVNQNAQLQVCVKKDFSPNLSLLAATCVSLTNISGLLTAKPAFGFKVLTKA